MHQRIERAARERAVERRWIKRVRLRELTPLHRLAVALERLSRTVAEWPRCASHLSL